METDELQIKIDEARALLPEQTRKAIDAVPWRSIIQNMSGKYTFDQLEDLEIETELVLCGITSPEEYIEELKSRLFLTDEKVDLLLNEIDNLIFQKIKEKIENKEEVVPVKKNPEKITINKNFIPDSNFANMPKGVQMAIANSNWKEKLYKIASKYKLNIEQMGILEEITIKVMRDEIRPYKYEEELLSKITTTKENISNLVNDVNQEILKLIRELLKKSWENESGQTKNEEVVPVPPYSKLIKNEELIIKNDKKIPEEKREPAGLIEENLNPTKNILEDKLKGVMISSHTISDYSNKENSKIPSIESVKEPLPRSYDPYREVF